MSPVMFWDNKVLLTPGRKIAMDPECCCGAADLRFRRCITDALHPTYYTDTDEGYSVGDVVEYGGVCYEIEAGDPPIGGTKILSGESTYSSCADCEYHPLRYCPEGEDWDDAESPYYVKTHAGSTFSDGDVVFYLDQCLYVDEDTAYEYNPGVEVTSAASEDSCSDCLTNNAAPCTCPEGLDTDYVVSWTGGSTMVSCGDDPDCETIPLSDPPVTVSVANDCYWSGTKGDNENDGVVVIVWLDTTNCVWKCRIRGYCTGITCNNGEGFVNTVFEGTKTLGDGPTGRYHKTGPGTSNVDDVIVAESA